MAGARERDLAVARVWANSLFALAAESGREDELLGELEGMVELLDRQPTLATLLASPAIDTEAKRALLEKALRGRASDLLVDALQVMRRKGRLVLIRAVAQTYRSEWLVRRHKVEVRVTSAVPLTEALREALRLAAAERTNRQPILVERIDPELLGGLVVAIGDEKIDSSVSTELEKMEIALLDRASRELLSGKSYFTEGQ
jgi:F-type H+-transporting ATPase subunit delta